MFSCIKLRNNLPYVFKVVYLVLIYVLRYSLLENNIQYRGTMYLKIMMS
jgi:hypothetical protein